MTGILSGGERRYVKAIGLLSVLCLFLFIFQEVAVGSIRYWFIPENLGLSWLSLLFAWVLARQLKVRRWASWQNIALTILWLGFLPNAWYVLTDFLHIYPSGDTTQLYDIVLLSTLVVSGFIVGFTSLYLVHQELHKRLGARWGLLIIDGVILLSSFAIYLGRFLRWNTWDVVTNPSGVILNVSDRIIDPLGYPRALTLTALFFLFIGVIYRAIWFFMKPYTNGKSR
ncbi:MAG: DUF1361 domain-containing protein [Candidatus Saccharimonadales bacterium]